MQTLIKSIIWMVSGLMIFSGCDTVTTLLRPAAEPTAVEIQPTAAPAAASFMFYNSYASW